ncbi:MAG TPA: LysR substrate-binding domain-containing protein, partial [Solirubrobacteraceae bacterium]|nr:LysR substrate-binding domain-containing protein [Solirubrobacteraceae bacterium]
LRDDVIDLAFLSVTEHIQSRGLQLNRLVTEELVAVLPTQHPLAGRDSVDLVDLAGDPFISFRAGSRLRELLDSASAGAGFEPRIALESNESRRIRSLVSSGLGVGILPRSDAVGGGAPVAVTRLVNPALTRDVTLASRAKRRHPPAAQAFLALTLRVFDSTRQPAIIEP